MLPRHAFAPIPIDVMLRKGMPIAVHYFLLRRMIPAATSSPLESAGNAVVSRVLSDSIWQPAQWHPSTLAHEIVQRRRAQWNPGGIAPIFLPSNGLQLKKMIIPVFENQANWVVRDQTTKEAGRNRVRATHTVLKSDGKKLFLAQEEEDVLSEKIVQGLAYSERHPRQSTSKSYEGIYMTIFNHPHSRVSATRVSSFYFNSQYVALLNVETTASLAVATVRYRRMGNLSQFAADTKYSNLNGSGARQHPRNLSSARLPSENGGEQEDVKIVRERIETATESIFEYNSRENTAVSDTNNLWQCRTAATDESVPSTNLRRSLALSSTQLALPALYSTRLSLPFSLNRSHRRDAVVDLDEIARPPPVPVVGATSMAAQKYLRRDTKTSGEKWELRRRTNQLRLYPGVSIRAGLKALLAPDVWSNYPEADFQRK
ncbi:hypothetical protein B0H16DRAFT_1480694 [Mycena metata]|uniref:Uncharacterized protein n=1 Tax=Mycena metata TaxID=1033252 RepID=A0AAD7H272_9AGAR|nr:hypothetical protein B0H16DRAFT_1480694 [Mycena metata]